MPTADATTDDAISNAPTADTTTRKKTGKQAAAKARKARKQAAAAVSAAVRKQAAEDAAAAAAAARAAEAAGKRPLEQAAGRDITTTDSTADDDAGLAAAMMASSITDANPDATPDTDATANATTDAPAQCPRPKPWFPVLLTRDVKLYGSLVATETVDGDDCDVIMRGNGKMTKKDKLSIAEKGKLVLWFGSSDWEPWTDEDWALTDNYITVVMRKKAPREQSVFSGFCHLMLADSALHSGRTTLYVKDLLTQPTGLAEITSFLPLLNFKVKERLPLAQRIAIVTDQKNLNHACEKFGYKEKKTYKKDIIVNYFDGQDEHTKWKVWLLDLA